jgi:hypothetical protein
MGIIKKHHPTRLKGAPGHHRGAATADLWVASTGRAAETLSTAGQVELSEGGAKGS